MGRLAACKDDLVGRSNERPTKSHRRNLPHESQVVRLLAAGWLLSMMGLVPTSLAATRYFHFDISYTNYTRNCATKPIMAVNGEYPGPTIHITEGDRVVLKLTNSASSNITIHWHGIQSLPSWQDGAGYVTQCPIQPGDYFVYDFVVSGQRGTTLWHAHVEWARATVYGAFVTDPLIGSYPFEKPEKEFVMVLGEWWNDDVEAVFDQGQIDGGRFAVADALTANGLPGPFYNCSESEGITTLDVEQGKTYLLRILNAALNTDLYLGVADHLMTVVEVDSTYVQPFTVDRGVVVAAGQTVAVLVTANQAPGSYYVVGKGHDTLWYLEDDDVGIPGVPDIPTAAIFQYNSKDPIIENLVPFYPILPATEDLDYTSTFESSIRSKDPVNLPVTNSNVRQMVYTVGAATAVCTADRMCVARLEGYRIIDAINNMSFQLPTTMAILEAFYYNVSGVYTAGLPDHPPAPSNYTDPVTPSYADMVAEIGTRTVLVEYGTMIQIVLQDIHNAAFVSHPFHLHGYFFYVIGRGFGNFDAETDPKSFNYYDPPARFTVSLPRGGWVAIRFTANNPGAWLFHCHLEKHSSMGLATVFLVKNGDAANQTLAEPPRLNDC